MALMTQPNLSTKNEETPKVTNATKRSSSIGIAFKRLFSKSPQHDLLQNEVVRSHSVSSPLGHETPQEASQTPRASAQSAGVRGRTPPKPYPGENSKGPQSLSVPPNPIQVQNIEYKVLGGLFPAQQSLLSHDRITRAAMAMAPSHRGGHDVSAYGLGEATGGYTAALTTATTHTYHGKPIRPTEHRLMLAPPALLLRITRNPNGAVTSLRESLISNGATQIQKS